MSSRELNDNEEGEAMEVDTRSTSVGNTAVGNHETPILYHSPDVKFFGNTRTMELKDKFYVTLGDVGVGDTFYSGREFSLRLNSPYIPVVVPSSYTLGVAGNAWNSGVYANCKSIGGTLIPDPLDPYVKTSTTSKVMPMLGCMSHYTMYTVLKTDWSITIWNPNADFNGYELFCHMDEAYSSTDSSRWPSTSWTDVWRNKEFTMKTLKPTPMTRVLTNNVVEAHGNAATGINFTSASENVTYSTEAHDIVPEHKDQIGPGGYESITFSGTWYPNRIHHNVKNDGDYKTWHDVGSVPANSVVEQATIRWCPGGHYIPLSRQLNKAFNAEVYVNYTVQFKDPGT